jgi:hypothetical protein
LLRCFTVELGEGLVEVFSPGEGTIALVSAIIEAADPLQEPRDQTVQQVEALIRAHPLQYLTTKVILSPENVPVRIVSTEEDHRQVAIVEYDARAVTLWAGWASDILRDVAVRQRPTMAELTQHFTTEIIATEVAERVATAVDHFWERRYDEALFVLVPRLESIIRELCRQLGLVIAKEPIGSDAGGFLQLGALLSSLKGRLPESRRCYLMTLSPTRSESTSATAPCTG